MKRGGFTLIEILTVMAIIGILVAIGAYVYSAALVRSRDSQRITDVQFMRNGLEQFYLDNRSYPLYDYQPTSPGLADASWQLEKGYSCQGKSSSQYLAPKYLSHIPQDPSHPFVLSTAKARCSANAFGQYLYFGLPFGTSKSQYYLLARMEAVKNVNYDHGVVDSDLHDYNNNNSAFCNSSQFTTDPTACSQNYFVTSAKNN